MSNELLQTELSHLFRDSAQAHHAAFTATGGADPEWLDIIQYLERTF